MGDQRNAGWPNQPGQGSPGQPFGQPPGSPPGTPPGAAPPPYGQPSGGSYTPPGGPPPYQPPYPAPPQGPSSAPPVAPPYGQPQPHGQPPSYGPPPAPGVPPGQAFPPGYRPDQSYPPPQYGQPAYPGAPPPQVIPARKKRKLWIILPAAVVGLLVILIVAAVVYQATLTPAVTSIQFAHNFQDNKAVGVTNTFTSTDSDLYAIINLNTSKGHPTIKVVWTVVNGTDANKRPVTGLEFGQVEKAATSRLLYASVSRGAATWPVGQYKADVYLDGKLAKTAQFTVTA